MPGLLLLLSLNQHRHLISVTVPSHFGHLLNTNVPHSNKGVSVQAGSTWGRRVIEMDKSQELLIVLGNTLNVLEGADSRGKYVAGIHANAETGVLELEDELNEVGYIS